MNDILKKLYESEGVFNIPFSEKYKALCQKDAKLWEKLEPLLGIDTLDELSDSCASVKDQSNYEWFREGFRLGASFMLEVFQG